MKYIFFFFIILLGISLLNSVELSYTTIVNNNSNITLNLTYPLYFDYLYILDNGTTYITKLRATNESDDTVDIIFNNNTYINENPIIIASNIDYTVKDIYNLLNYDLYNVPISLYVNNCSISQVYFYPSLLNNQILNSSQFSCSNNILTIILDYLPRSYYYNDTIYTYLRIPNFTNSVLGYSYINYSNLNGFSLLTQSGCSSYTDSVCNYNMFPYNYNYSLVVQNISDGLINYPIWAYPNISCFYYAVDFLTNDKYFIKSYKVKANGGQYCTVTNKWNWYVYKLNESVSNLNLSFIPLNNNSYYELYYNVFESSVISNQIYIYDTFNNYTYNPSVVVIENITQEIVEYRGASLSIDFDKPIYLILLILIFIIIILLLLYGYITLVGLITFILGLILLFSGVIWIISFSVLLAGILISLIPFGIKIVNRR